MVHKRIGVEPKLYLSAIMTLKNLITNILKSNIKKKDEIEASIETLDKMSVF